MVFHHFIVLVTKGQMISKGRFGVLEFSQKTNKQICCSSENEFVCLFFGRIRGYLKSFRNYLTLFFEQDKTILGMAVKRQNSVVKSQYWSWSKSTGHKKFLIERRCTRMGIRIRMLLHELFHPIVGSVQILCTKAKWDSAHS